MRQERAIDAGRTFAVRENMKLSPRGGAMCVLNVSSTFEFSPKEQIRVF